MHLLVQTFWEHIWKYTAEQSQINASCVTVHPLRQAIWGHIWKRPVEKSKSNATNVNEDSFENTQNKCNRCDFASSRKGNLKVHLIRMWMCIAWIRRFEETYENAQWRKANRMQPMWICILSVRPFEETFENTQWGKVKQMQPMWLCMFPSKLRTHLWKHKIQPMWVGLFTMWLKVGGSFLFYSDLDLVVEISFLISFLRPRGSEGSQSLCL